MSALKRALLETKKFVHLNPALDAIEGPRVLSQTEIRTVLEEGDLPTNTDTRADHCQNGHELGG